MYSNRRAAFLQLSLTAFFRPVLSPMPPRPVPKVKYKDKEVVLTLDSDDALVNGQVIKLDVPAMVVKGRTLIPLRFVSEQIGMKVKWDEKNKSITITE
jgi:hypothetical protein